MCAGSYLRCSDLTLYWHTMSDISISTYDPKLIDSNFIGSIFHNINRFIAGFNSQSRSLIRFRALLIIFVAKVVQYYYSPRQRWSCRQKHSRGVMYVTLNRLSVYSFQVLIFCYIDIVINLNGYLIFMKRKCSLDAHE